MDDSAMAELLLAARGGVRVPAGQVAPVDVAQAARVQALVMAGLGAIGGWKVGASGPDAPVACAPMPAAFLFDAPARLDPAVFSQREVESEICFRLRADLPAGPAYTRQAVLDAIGSCHPGIEVLQSRLADPQTASSLAMLADLLQTGAYVIGPPIKEWQALDFALLTVTQTIEPGGIVDTATGNPAGDMIRLMQALANGGAAWAGGLRAGQVVTCGSWTGKTVAGAGSSVTAVFAGAGAVEVRFGE